MSAHQDPRLGGDGEDSVLVRAISDGDERALQELFARHAPWLNARCADPDAVADVLQDTFVAVWKSARHWRGDGEVAAWLWGIAARRLASRLRANPAVHRLGQLPQLAHIGLDEKADLPLSSAEEQVLLGVEHGDVGTALNRLSPELRAVVQATILDGLTTREAARLLGLPQGTVKGRIRKAKALLRTDLIQYEG